MFKIFFLACFQIIFFATFSQTIPEELTKWGSVTDSIKPISDITSLVRDNNRVQLSWKVTDSMTSPFFSIERNSNGKDFEVVAVVKLSITNSQYEWTDDSPLKGRNLYRVRISGKNGEQFYSRPLAVQIEEQSAYKFYPNPVDNILIIRCGAPVDVQITDANGKIRISQNRVSGLQTINVSTLEKGIYLLRITNKQNNGIIQDKLIKN